MRRTAQAALAFMFAAGLVIPAMARDRSAAPDVISWFDPAAVQAQLQGTWKNGSDLLTIEGTRITSKDPSGVTTTYKLLVEQPGRISFEDSEGGAANYGFAVNGDARYLFTGTAGIKRGDLYVVGDGWAGNGVVVFDAKKKTCIAAPLNFGEWGAAVAVECALGEKDGLPVLHYGYPRPAKSDKEGMTLKMEVIYVVGEALLETPTGGGPLERVKP